MDNTQQSAEETRIGYLALFIIAIVLAGIFVILFKNAYHSAYMASHKHTSRQNLKHIASAARDYYEVHGHFPPVRVIDFAGGPKRSWRVELLPYFDVHRDAPTLNDLGRSYRKDFAWNAADNQTVSEQVVDMYRHPFEPGPITPTTNYLAVVGAGFVHNDNGPISQTDITDDPSTTILYVEYFPSSVRWAEPKDLSFDQYANYVTSEANLPPRSDRFAVAMADGSVQSLAPGLPIETLRALFTHSGGEEVDPAIFR